MNKNIENILNEYMKNPDPQHAVFLKGDWGCGKTFFVNNWLNSYKKKIPEEQILKPVMVSFYGLSEIKQIAAINPNRSLDFHSASSWFRADCNVRVEGIADYGETRTTAG